MSIADYVRFDERSSKIIEEKFNFDLNRLLTKFGYDKNNLVFLEEKNKLVKQKNELIERLIKINTPLFSTKLITQISIEWAEVNNMISFTKAYQQVVSEINKKYKTSENMPFNYNNVTVDSITNADMLTDNSDISVEEAKEMMKSLEIKSPLYDDLVQESQQFYKFMQGYGNLGVFKYILNISKNDSFLKINDYKDVIHIPDIVIKALIAKIKNIEIKDDIAGIEQIKDIPIPEFYQSWN